VIFDISTSLPRKSSSFNSLRSGRLRGVEDLEAALERFREIVNDLRNRENAEKIVRESFPGASVPEGIPPAVPWDQLEKKGKKIPARVKSIRGKLNVPRERFHLTSDGSYLWAGKK